jgi:hypothetical protein
MDPRILFKMKMDPRDEKGLERLLYIENLSILTIS